MNLQKVIDETLKMNELNIYVINYISNIKDHSMVDKKSFKQYCHKLIEFENAKIRVRKLISGISFMKINDELARSLLNKVNKNEPFEADLMLAILNEKDIEKYLEDQTDIEYLSETELNDMEFELFYNNFSPLGYVQSMYGTEKLILGVEVPNYLIQYVNDVREYIAFNQYNAACALCRTLLESSLRDIGRRKEWIRYSKEYDPKKLREIIILDKLNNEILFKKTCKLYKNISEGIHGFQQFNYKECIDIYKNTFEIISKIYQLASLL